MEARISHTGHSWTKTEDGIKSTCFMALLLVRFNKGATTAAWHSVVEVAAGKPEPKEAAWAANQNVHILEWLEI